MILASQPFAYSLTKKQIEDTMKASDFQDLSRFNLHFCSFMVIINA